MPIKNDASNRRGADFLDGQRKRREKSETLSAAGEGACALELDLFYAHLPDHTYIHRPDGTTWSKAGVDGGLPKVPSGATTILASLYLDRNRAVQQMTWIPGEPELIVDKLICEGGIIERPGARVYNQYRAPAVLKGNARAANRWRDHLRGLYPDEADEIERWLAHRVQRPGEKINHALFLGGAQGVGKDTLLEPVKRTVGAWNWADITPQMVVGRFNGWAKSTVARVSEVHDLGDIDRFAFYEHTKIYAAAPPDVIRVDEKNLREHAIPNVVGLIMLTNYSITGLYLPPDDRRHFVASTAIERSEFSVDYFANMYHWYDQRGAGDVGEFLRTLDLRGFDPKAPPRQTDAWRSIVMANAAPEESDLTDLLEMLGKPEVVTLAMLRESADNRHMRDLVELLNDKRRRRVIPHRMADAGYDFVPNPSREKDGLWWIKFQRVVVYGRRDVDMRDRVERARGLT